MRRINKPLYNKAKRLIQDGHNYGETAKMIGVTPKTVSKWAKLIETEEKETDDVFTALRKKFEDLEYRVKKLEG